MKVLVTGGLGFVGSNLVTVLVENGHEVVVLDNLDPHMGGNWMNLEEVRSKIDLKVQNLLDFGQLSELVRDKDLIVNCAASTSHPSSMREPWLDIDVNVRGTLNILEAVRRFNPRVRLIHLGTSTQLGPLNYMPADENHQEFPLDIYSANKSTSEKYVLIYAGSYGLRASVLRLANLYGPKAAIHSSEFTFNNYFIGLALQNKTISIYGDGKQKRNIMYIDDAIAAIMALVDSEVSIGQTYFAVADDHISVLDFAQTVVTAFKSGKCETIAWPQERKATEVGDAIITSKKIKSATRWMPRVSMEKGLKRTMDFYLPRLTDYLK